MTPENEALTESIPFPAAEAPEASAEPRQPPQLPDELSEAISEVYQSVGAHAAAAINELIALTQKFGTPEPMASQTFQKIQEHLDLAIGFYAHRYATLVLPGTWARHATQKGE